MKKTLYILTAIVALAAGCKKANFKDNTVTGEGLVNFTLKTPASSTVIVLNAATPATSIVFTWNASRPGLTTTPKYKAVFALKTGGDLQSPLISFDADNTGTATTLTLTYQQLDAALLAKGIAAGAVTELIWSVQADNGSVKLMAQSVFNITITRFKDGASPFFLLGPVPTTSPIEINPTSTTDQITFNWTKSKPVTGGPAVKYRVLFTNNSNFTSPLFSIVSNNGGLDTLLTVTTKQISDSLAAHGYADLGLQADLKWTVVATSGTWNQQSDYINTLSILRQVNLYLVGDVNTWDFNAPLKLVVDKKVDRYGKVFYTYVKMNAGNKFLFIKEIGNSSSKYGVTGGGAGGIYEIGYNAGADFQVASTGVYRLTIDLASSPIKAYVQQKQVGVVGNMQGWDAGAPIFGGYIKRDQFLIIAPSNGTDEFKLHDGLVWDNGTPDKARWWGDAGGGNLDIDGNGGNLVANTAPRTRVIWDGSNVQQVKYEKYPASEMRVVGDGINQAGVNDWDPPTSPQMTYSGNGIWTITLALKANKEFKFVAGNAWGAFDYEDNSGQIQTTGTPRPIQWTGGNNFKTPLTAATYTITLNEYTQIVTVN